MKVGVFSIDWIYLLYYKCHEINFILCKSYKDSPDWIKNKKATIDPVNDDDECLQYAATVH